MFGFTTKLIPHEDIFSSLNRHFSFLLPHFFYLSPIIYMIKWYKNIFSKLTSCSKNTIFKIETCSDGKVMFETMHIHKGITFRTYSQNCAKDHLHSKVMFKEPVMICKNKSACELRSVTSWLSFYWSLFTGLTVYIPWSNIVYSGRHAFMHAHTHRVIHAHTCTHTMLFCSHFDFHFQAHIQRQNQSYVHEIRCSKYLFHHWIGNIYFQATCTDVKFVMTENANSTVPIFVPFQWCSVHPYHRMTRLYNLESIPK